MKFVIKMLVLGSLPFMLFACGDGSSSNSSDDNNTPCAQYTGSDKDACLQGGDHVFLPAQIKETSQPV